MFKVKYLFLFSFFLLILPLISAGCGPGTWEDCDYYINDSDGDNICVEAGGYTYILNVSDYYNWSQGPIDNDFFYRARGVQQFSSTQFWHDYAYIEEDYYYMTIPYNSTFYTLYTYNESLVIETGSHNTYNGNMDQIEIEYEPDYFNDYVFDDFIQNTTCNVNYENASEKYSVGGGGGCVDNCSGLTGLISYKSFNETATLYNADTINISLNSTLQGGSAGDNSDTGYSSYCLNFTPNSYANTTSIPMIEGTNDRSIFMWVHPDTYSGGQKGLYSYGSASTNQWFLISLTNANKYLELLGYGNDQASTLAVPANQWSYVGLTYTSGNLTFYVGNSSVLNYESYSKSGYNTASTQHQIGGSTSGGIYLDGRIDELMIYNRTLNHTEVQYLLDNTPYPFNISEGGGGGGGNETNCTNMSQIKQLVSPVFGYNEDQFINLSEYFCTDYAYDVFFVYDDPYTYIQNVLSNGYATANSDYFEATLGSGFNFNLTLESYERFYDGTFDVIFCDNESNIDTTCPVAGFPASCNITALYEDSNCINDSINMVVTENYTSPVTRYQNWTLYHYISDYGNKSFSMTSYYNNYNWVNVTFIDPLLNGTQEFGCTLGSGTNSTINGTNNVTWECLGWTAYLDVNSNNISQNITFYVNASNVNNTLSDYFIILTGNYSETLYPPVEDEGNFSIGLNLSEVTGFFEESGNSNTDNFVILVILIVVGVFFIIFFGLTSIGIHISLAVVWLIALAFSAGGLLNWVYVITPAVIYIAYFILKLIGGSS